AERLDSASAGGGVAMYGRQNVQGDALLDVADFPRNVRVEANSLHWDSYSPWCWRTWSIVKPHSATTCSKGMPPSGFCRKESREEATARRSSTVSSSPSS